jgi:hypothetical protein
MTIRIPRRRILAVSALVDDTPCRIASKTCWARRTILRTPGRESSISARHFHVRGSRRALITSPADSATRLVASRITAFKTWNHSSRCCARTIVACRTRSATLLTSCTVRSGQTRHRVVFRKGAAMRTRTLSTIGGPSAAVGTRWALHNESWLGTCITSRAPLAVHSANKGVRSSNTGHRADTIGTVVAGFTRAALGGSCKRIITRVATQGSGIGHWTIVSRRTRCTATRPTETVASSTATNWAGTRVRALKTSRTNGTIRGLKIKASYDKKSCKLS